MNQNLKTKVVALIAILCGGSFTQSHAMQADSEFKGYAPSGVHASESGYSSRAFGSVRAAAPVGDQDQSKLPPIVSADSVSSDSASPWRSGEFVPEPVPMAIPKMSAHVPPIVSADSEMARPAPPIVSGDSMRKSTIAAVKKPERNLSNMLAPIAEPAKKVAKPASMPAPPMASPMPKRTAMAAPAPSMMEAAMPAPVPEVVQATTSTEPDAANKVQQAAQWGPRGVNASYSSAGVPIYPKQEGEIFPGSIQSMPSVVEAPAMQMQQPTQQVLPPIISADSQLVSPVDPMISPGAVPIAPAPQMSVQQPLPPQPSYMTGESYIEAPIMDAPVMMDSSCSSCSGGGCSSCTTGGVSSCQSCGSNGCFSEGVVANQFGCCGSVYSARRYLVADALYFDREDGLVSNSNFGALGNFDWNWGWRITLGTRNDATSGQEFSYMGTLGIEQERNRVDALGRLNSSFTFDGGFTGVESSAFRSGSSLGYVVTQQNERKETTLHSLEFNRVKWGWDVIKTFVGLRYIYVDDEYEMFSRGTDGVTEQTGTFQMDALNNMFGPHIGGELFYDIGYRVSTSLVAKAGGYVNVNRVDTNLVNNGTQFLDVRDENVTIAGSLELGLIGHYQLSRQARFRFGYNLLWLGEVASVSDNFSPILTPLTGTDSGDSDDMLFHGISLGFEVYR